VAAQIDCSAWAHLSGDSRGDRKVGAGERHSGIYF
jgi:hypothetical protein